MNHRAMAAIAFLCPPHTCGTVVRNHCILASPERTMKMWCLRYTVRPTFLSMSTSQGCDFASKAAAACTYMIGDPLYNVVLSQERKVLLHKMRVAANSSVRGGVVMVAKLARLSSSRKFLFKLGCLPITCCRC